MTAPVDLRYFAGRIEKLSKRLDQVPRMSWATVVTTAPLTIHVDGDPAPLIGEVKNAGPKVLLPGTRVQVMRQDLRYTVISASVDVPSRGTSAQRVALGLSGAVEDGHRFYDTDEKREYVWANQDWQSRGSHENDGTYPVTIASGFTGSISATRFGDEVEVSVAVTGTVGTGSHTSLGTLPVEVRPTSRASGRRNGVLFVGGARYGAVVALNTGLLAVSNLSTAAGDQAAGTLIYRI